MSTSTSSHISLILTAYMLFVTSSKLLFGLSNNPNLTVTQTGDGKGNVTSSPAGIDCGSDCNQQYDYGVSVTLCPKPEPGSSFQGWSGDCSGSGQCQVAMTQDREVGASFQRKGYRCYFSKDNDEHEKQCKGWCRKVEAGEIPNIPKPPAGIRCEVVSFDDHSATAWRSRTIDCASRYCNYYGHSTYYGDFDARKACACALQGGAICYGSDSCLGLPADQIPAYVASIQDKIQNGEISCHEAKTICLHQTYVHADYDGGQEITTRVTIHIYPDPISKSSACGTADPNNCKVAVIYPKCSTEATSFCYAEYQTYVCQEPDVYGSIITDPTKADQQTTRREICCESGGKRRYKRCEGESCQCEELCSIKMNKSCIGYGDPKGCDRYGDRRPEMWCDTDRGDGTVERSQLCCAEVVEGKITGREDPYSGGDGIYRPYEECALCSALQDQSCRQGQVCFYKTASGYKGRGLCCQDPMTKTAVIGDASGRLKPLQECFSCSNLGKECKNGQYNAVCYTDDASNDQKYVCCQDPITKTAVIGDASGRLVLSEECRLCSNVLGKECNGRDNDGRGPHGCYNRLTDSSDPLKVSYSDQMLCCQGNDGLEVPYVDPGTIAKWKDCFRCQNYIGKSCTGSWSTDCYDDKDVFHARGVTCIDGKWQRTSSTVSPTQSSP